VRLRIFRAVFEVQVSTHGQHLRTVQSFMVSSGNVFAMLSFR